MKDLFGMALKDYHSGNYTDDLYTETNISEEDVLPLPYLFRSYSEMPPLEQLTISNASGKVLDVSCGPGSVSLYLQESGLDVMAIDSSDGALEVCNLRGFKNAKEIDLLQLKDQKFDTVLLVMNGTGIFQKLEHIDQYLQHLKSLLDPEGQIIIDSSDLRYRYDSDDKEGSIVVPPDGYYAELKFTVYYKE